jgi:TDG/mug DNA glycosylase family protein
LLYYGYGLTNLIAKPTAGIQDLTRQDFLKGYAVLLEKIKKYQPGIVAVLGISVARVLLASVSANASQKGVVSGPVQTGLQPIILAGARVFVLPNPSGRNAHYSYQTMKDVFSELKAVSLQS